MYRTIPFFFTIQNAAASHGSAAMQKNAVQYPCPRFQKILERDHWLHTAERTLVSRLFPENGGWFMTFTRNAACDEAKMIG